MVVAGLKMRAPHTLSAQTEPSVVSRNPRGSPSPRVVRDVQLRERRRARGWDTTASTRRLVIPKCLGAPHHRGMGEPAFDPGVSWAASTLPRPQADVADHSVVMTPRRFRDTAAGAACSDRMCGAQLSSATSIDRGHRPSETPGPSGGEQQPLPQRANLAYGERRPGGGRSIRTRIPSSATSSNAPQRTSATTSGITS